MPTHEQEIQAGERFEFGKNWARFLRALTEPQIQFAEQSLRTMLGADDLTGWTFLDVGSGSGLFSLAARRLGARVHSFDFDPNSVACGKELRRRYFGGDSGWVIEEGSALDQNYLSSLGTFDIVYSWGVLHHTGAMWPALANVAPLVKRDGLLFIALYNDQGTPSRRWTRLKRLYNRTPPPLRFLISVPVLIQQYWRPVAKDFVLLRPFHSIRNYEGKARGMTVWRDLIDWVGGYPFEVARPEEVFEFYKARGFQLRKLKTCGGTLGCNEFVFQRMGEDSRL
jgi:2-polyprenyl-6-hydroxyphenyl methylase/3-demethylubiquinone-9 3-methyltransferase